MRKSACRLPEPAISSQHAIQPLQKEIEFVRKHGFQPRATHIAIASPINRITESHVIGGNRFCNRSGCTTNGKKVSSHLLTRADFGKRAVEPLLHIDTKCLALNPSINLMLHTC